MSTDYLVQNIYNASTGVSDWVAEVGLWIYLYDGDPGTDGASGTLITTVANGVPPVLVNWTAIIKTPGDEISPTVWEWSNNAAVTLGNLTIPAPVQITHAGLRNASDGGSILYRGPLAQAQVFKNNHLLYFPENSLKILVRDAAA
jgi:hypothetical protein